MNKSSISLLFSGDFAPLLPPEQIGEDHFSEIHDILDQCDLHITNLECPLTNSNKAIPKTGPHLKGSPDNIRLLKLARVGIACLANNHVFDYDEEGINDTIDACERNGIECIGIVHRKDGKPHWIIKEIKGKKIGFLNYCEHEFSVREYGFIGATGYDSIRAFYDIKELRPQVDWLIVIYHGGVEYCPLPPPYQQKIFRFLADLGADVVIGHHSHVFSGYEIYHGKPLIYSIGNFFFPSSDEPDRWYYAMLCELELRENCHLKFYPLVQCYHSNRVLLPDKMLMENLKKDQDHFGNIILNEKDLRKQWLNHVQTKKNGYLKILYHSTFLEKLLLKLGLPEQLIFSHKHSLVFKNILNCQAHYEIALQVLSNLQKQNI